MSSYLRRRTGGGQFFFTLVTERRFPLFASALARRLLRESLAQCGRARPFTLDAIILLPDHLHALWTLPAGDDDYSGRWAWIKGAFTRRWLAAGGAERPRSASRIACRRRGVWQRRFFEHSIRNDRDFERHVDYIHYNPVKHERCACPHAWPHSSFARWVDMEVYDADWMCACGKRRPTPPDLDDLAAAELE